MYDNNYPNNYPNRYPDHSGTQQTGTQQAGPQQNQGAGQPGIEYRSYQNQGSYQYGGAYAGSYAQAEQKKEKKAKRQGSYFKKALAAVSLGLFFGLFAGLGLYIVESASGMLDRDKIMIQEETGSSSTTEAKASQTPKAEPSGAAIKQIGRAHV